RRRLLSRTHRRPRARRRKGPHDPFGDGPRASSARVRSVSSLRKQRLIPPFLAGYSAGTSRGQRENTSPHRVWNRHPPGGFKAEGKSAPSTAGASLRIEARAARVSEGTDDRSARV